MSAADIGRRETFAVGRIAEAAERYRNWNQCGEDDVLGTLNFIDDGARAHAATLARRGRPFSLSMKFDANGPQRGAYGRVNPIHTMTMTGDDAVAGRQGFPHGVGGADAHPTSPYAAYGAGMSIEDGYFLARELDAVDVADTAAVRGALQAYEDRRKPHTRQVTEQAYFTGKMFHHTPRLLQPLRDLVYDHTPLLQKVVGDATPKQILSQLDEIEDPLPTAGSQRTPT